MELKNKKYVYNTGKLPRYEDGMFAYDKSSFFVFFYILRNRFVWKMTFYKGYITIGTSDVDYGNQK